MKRGPKPIELDIEALKKDYESAGLVELAAKYGVSQKSILKRLKAARVEMRPRGRQKDKYIKLTEEQVIDIAITYIENPKIGLRELARRHNANHENKVSHETVRKELINAGVELRPVGGDHANSKKSTIIQPLQDRKAYRLVTNDLAGLFFVPEKSLRRRITPQTLSAGRGQGRCVPN